MTPTDEVKARMETTEYYPYDPNEPDTLKYVDYEFALELAQRLEAAQKENEDLKENISNKSKQKNQNEQPPFWLKVFAFVLSIPIAVSLVYIFLWLFLMASDWIHK